MSEDLKPLYLIVGNDTPKIERAVGRLLGRFEASATERLNASTASGDVVVAACNALGLFATDGRLVLVDEVERWKAADAKAIAEYAKAPAPATTLALVGAEVKLDGPLGKAVAKAGEVLAYEFKKRELPKWVAEQFALRGIKASNEVCRMVAGLVGEDLQKLSSEIDKLATWAGREQLTPDDVAELIALREDLAPWTLTDAWGRRDTAGVLQAAETLLERSGSRELPAIVGRLAAHVRRVAACKALDEEGVRPRDAMTKIGARHPYVAEQAFTQSRNFTVDELRAAVVELADLDYALKGGSRLPTEFELERSLIALTRRAD